MAYPNYNPYQSYQPGFTGYQTFPQYFPQYQQLQQSQQMQPGSVNNAGQIQNGGFVSVSTVEEAYNWPIEPGHSVTFKVENSPYICTKTKGFSQLDQPIFEKYRLVKEEDQTAQNSSGKEQAAPAVDLSEYALRSEVDSLKSEIEHLRAEFCDFSAKKPVKTTKKAEVEE